MIIIRYSPFGDGTRYATCEPEQLDAYFPEATRAVETLNTPIGPITRVEGTGRYRRDRLRLSFRDGRCPTGYKLGEGAGRAHIRSLDHKRHVRVLSQLDEDALQTFDAAIDELERKIDAERNRRAEYLASTWRRASPLGLDELERRAEGKITR